MYRVEWQEYLWPKNQSKSIKEKSPSYITESHRLFTTFLFTARNIFKFIWLLLTKSGRYFLTCNRESFFCQQLSLSTCSAPCFRESAFYKTVMEVWAPKTVRVIGCISSMKLPGIKRISSGKIEEDMRFPFSFPISAIKINFWNFNL